MQVIVYNRGPAAAPIHVLPHLWFRNYWKHNDRYNRPRLSSVTNDCIQTSSSRNGSYYFHHEGGEQLFMCMNSPPARAT